MDSYFAEYRRELDDYERVVGAKNEGTVCQAFGTLLKLHGAAKKLILAQQYAYRSRLGAGLRIDGALVDRVRLVHGFWEAKDTKDDLNQEIRKKIAVGYPCENIIFEDTRTAILYQNGQELARANTNDEAGLNRLLERFFEFKPADVEAFAQAVRLFRADLPSVITALDEAISTALDDIPLFKQKFGLFLQLAQTAIGPTVDRGHVTEMLIQHILTEQIFVELFGDDEFHRENNLAVALTDLERSFLHGGTRHDLLKRMEPYYAAIRRAAAGAVSANDKQDFLKAIYEDFYTAYNPKDADRLGIVYTPSEVVRFIIAGCDRITQSRFQKRLASVGVDILDPCAGTGTFEVELIDFFRDDRANLARKFAEEVHSNEISILPYYIASLNVERALAEALEQWQPYTGACFVNTLQNYGFKQITKGAQQSFLGQLTDVNYARIQQQNSRSIPVIMGNPPYNANQKAEDDNNKNEASPAVDSRIRSTYLKMSNATKTKLYDPYVRFFRWSSDRIGECGVVAFITNRGYLDKRGYDGFRRTIQREYQQVWIIDLKGDVRDNTKISGSKHNIFGIQTGVAIVFLVRDPSLVDCEINYAAVPSDFMTGVERLRWLASNPWAVMASTGTFARINPTAEGDWLNQPTSDWSEFLPMGTKAVKSGDEEEAIFRHYSLGISTNRDAWVYDADVSNLQKKARYLASHYHSRLKSEKADDGGIKWSRNLKRRLSLRRSEEYSSSFVREAMYRPFVKRYIYDSHLFLDERGSLDRLFPLSRDNIAICTIGDATPKPFSVLATGIAADLNFISPAAAGTKMFPLYTFSSDGSREDNITNWALRRFRETYNGEKITKKDIFYYIYAILHDPRYRAKYAINLRKSYPRIPMRPNFSQWKIWGRQLVELHTKYEKVDPWPLSRQDQRGQVVPPIPQLRIKDNAILIDNVTTLTGLPPKVLTYMLGNRSALQWVLDLAKPTNPTNTTGVISLDRDRHNYSKEVIIDDVKKICRIADKTLKLMADISSAKQD